MAEWLPLEPLEAFWNSVVTFVPSLIGAVILLIIGWIVGAVIGRITKELLVRFRVDQYITKKRPIIRLSDIFPIIFEWTIYLVFIQSAVETLGIVALADFVKMIINFIPGLIGAVIVVIVGYGIAEYIRSEVIHKSKIAYSELMGNMLFWFIIYIAIALALPLVKIDPTVLLIIVGSFGVGIALAIGLGLKDVIAEMAKSYARKARTRR